MTFIKMKSTLQANNALSTNSAKNQFAGMTFNWKIRKNFMTYDSTSIRFLLFLKQLSLKIHPWHFSA